MANHLNIFIIYLAFTSICISFSDAKSRQRLLMEDSKTEEMYNAQMERELNILKRQNPHFAYSRPNDPKDNKYDNELENNSSNPRLDVTEKLRQLSESLSFGDKTDSGSQQTQNEGKGHLQNDIFESFDTFNAQPNIDMLHILDDSNTGCSKNMNYQKNEDHTYHKDTKKQLEDVQKEFAKSKSEALKSNKDILVEQLASQHSQCFFGLTSIWKSSHIKDYISYCKLTKDIDFNSRIFQAKLKNIHLQLQYIPVLFHSKHQVTCGVLEVQLERINTDPLLQILPYLCFDRISEENRFDEQQAVKLDL